MTVVVKEALASHGHLSKKTLAQCLISEHLRYINSKGGRKIGLLAFIKRSELDYFRHKAGAQRCISELKSASSKEQRRAHRQWYKLALQGKLSNIPQLEEYINRHY